MLLFLYSEHLMYSLNCKEDMLRLYNMCMSEDSALSFNTRNSKQNNSTHEVTNTHTSEDHAFSFWEYLLLSILEKYSHFLFIFLCKHKCLNFYQYHDQVDIIFSLFRLLIHMFIISTQDHFYTRNSFYSLLSYGNGQVE